MVFVSPQIDAAIYEMSVRTHLMDPDRASLNACTAVDADVLFEHDLSFSLQALRVRAPFAAQRAALEEDQCPHPGSVVHIVFLDIEYDRFTFDQISILAAHDALTSSLCVNLLIYYS